METTAVFAGLDPGMSNNYNLQNNKYKKFQSNLGEQKKYI
jgi:hypothetical protein